MRRFSLILISLLFPALCFAQELATPCTPQANSFVEAPGSGAGIPCWNGAASVCRNTGVISGGTPTIVSSADGTVIGQSCGQAIEIVQANSAESLNYYPFYIAANPTGDIYVRINVVSQSIASGSSAQMISFISTSGQLVEIQIHNSGGTLQAQAVGSTGSTLVTITLGEHLFHVHLASGTSAASLQIDGGTTRTFTEGGSPTYEVTLGNGGTTTTETFDVESVAVSVPGIGKCAQNTWPSAFVNLDDGILGNNLGTADLLAETLGNASGSWSLNGLSESTLTYVSGSLGLLNHKQDVCGVVYQGSSTLAMRYSVTTSGGTAGYARYALRNSVPAASMAFMLNINGVSASDTSFLGIASIRDNSGSNEIAFHELSTGSQLRFVGECIISGTTTQVGSINISASHPYAIVMQFTEGASVSSYVHVYDPANSWTELSGSPLTCTGLVGAPQDFDIGKSGSEADVAGEYWDYQSIFMNWDDGSTVFLP